MNSFYWLSTIPISFILLKSIKENIDNKYKRKNDENLLNIYYKQHLQCLNDKGYNYDINNELNENDFKVILNNKDIKELESCKNTYFNFIKVYRKHKNNSF
jgi:hypothetical protein